MTNTKTAENLNSILARLSQCDRTVISKIHGQYGLLSVNISYWRGQHRIKDANISLNGDDLSENESVSKPYWHLVPKEWKDKFQSIDAGRNAILNSYSVPSTLRGVHVVMADKLEDCCARLKQLETKLNELADDFCSEDNYNQFLEDMKQKLSPEAYQDAKKHIPPRKGIRAACHMSWNVLPTALPDWAVKGDSFQANEMQRSERTMIAENLRGALTAPRERLAADIDRLLGQLTEDGQLKEKRRIRCDSVAALLRNTEEFKNFDDLVDRSLLDQLDTFGKELTALETSMQNDKEAKAPLQINNDDALAQAWVETLRNTRMVLLSEQSMVAGIRRLCATVGLEL